MDRALRVWRWRIFAATWLSYAGYYFCRKPFYISKAALGESFGWSASRLGLLGSVYLITYAAGQFIAGAAGNRWGPRLLLLIGMGVTVGANAAFGLSNSYGTFAALMALNGLAQGTGWSGNVGTMANWFRRGERGTVMGFWATNFQVGGVLANTLASFVLDAAGFKWSFFTGSVVLLGVWIFFFFNQRNKPEDEGLPSVTGEEAGPDTGAKGASSEALRPPKKGWSRAIWVNVLTIGVFYFFVKFIRYSLWSWAPYMLRTSYGMDFDDAGYLSTLFDLAGIAGVIVVGVLSDKVFGGRRAGISFLFILLMAGSCFFLYLFGGSGLWLFGTALALIGFTLYGPDALMSGAGAIDVGSPRSAALAAGIINGIGSIGSVAQELVMGYLLDSGQGDGGVGSVFAVLVASSLAAAACLGVLLLRRRGGKADV